MDQRVELHDRFVAKFHFGERPSPVSVQDLDTVEVALSTKLPAAYRMFMTRHGAIYTPSILRGIVERNLDHVDLQNFDAPNDVIEGNKGYWSAGMPRAVIGIAGDCMGNMIGFNRQCVSMNDVPVVFFDHDLVDVYEVAGSFDEFLSWYLDNL